MNLLLNRLCVPLHKIKINAYHEKINEDWVGQLFLGYWPNNVVIHQPTQIT